MVSRAATFTLTPFDLFVLPTRTRFPFRYGIASMTDVPQVFVRGRIQSNGRSQTGLAAEGLPPKWFTKNPSTTFEQDLPEMLAAIRHAATAAAGIARQPITFFDLWRELDRQQAAWAASRGMASLLAHLGVSLVERAVVDAVCRALGEPLHSVLRGDQLGINPGGVYEELGATSLGDLLPEEPLAACHVRHTVGLGDPLTAADVSQADAGGGSARQDERVEDGLPQDLESSIRAYGLRYFKIKLTGKGEIDRPRLERIVELLDREAPADWRVTLDGNENFRDFHTFRAYWEDARAWPALQPLWPRVLVVEQPVHRDQALADDVGPALREWSGRPRLIVDESDGAVGDVPRALALGYAGASHKNCKGLVKGLANAVLLRARSRSGADVVLTGEDLANLGPVALLQDLAMMALLGIGHVERNGHHYYRGLSMFPADWQESMLVAHGDLYRRHEEGFAALRIVEGRIDLGSVNAAPFGVAPAFDPAVFERLD
jgi:L-alanine-DL-glutamate epimerase-like enolase superfamily enzyme